MDANHRVTDAIIDVGRRWAAAELRGDTEALADLLTEDFVGVGPRGFTLGKRAWLERYTSGALVHDEFTWDDVQVRAYGNAAIAVGIEDAKGSYAGHPVTGRCRTTQVLVHVGGRWVIAGMHLSPALS